jgi:acid phosphatase family membrane protein YuiD
LRRCSFNIVLVSSDGFLTSAFSVFGIPTDHSVVVTARNDHIGVSTGLAKTPNFTVIMGVLDALLVSIISSVTNDQFS